MDDHIHLIITSEKGDTISLPFSRKKARLVIISSISALAFLVVTCIALVTVFNKPPNVDSELAHLREKLQASADLIAEQKRKSEAALVKLKKKVASLERDKSRQEAKFKAEKEGLISSAISELNERSELIEKVMGSIGIKMPKNTKTDNKNSGGPYIREQPGDHDELLFRADKYLNTIRNLPMGKPVDRGSISSGFGKRIDPVNGKIGYHSGIDYRANRGDKVHATADGIVKKAFKNGGYGNFVLIDHGNGYTSSFSHLDKYLVKKGDRVERGQVIGLVGNTGRSTGTHLHYEICLDKKPINPYQFMKVASVFSEKSSKQKKK